MGENQKTKVCTKCGRELPLDSFYPGTNKDGRKSWCADCCRKYSINYNRSKKNAADTLNPALAEFTPQQLITELRARGYKGQLEYTEVKKHIIRV